MGEDKWKMIVGLWLWIIKYQEGYQSISILLQNFFSDYCYVIWLRLMWSDGILTGDWFFLFLFFFWIKWWYIYFLIVWLLGEGLGFDYVGKIETTLINLLLYIWVYIFRLFIYYFSFFFNLLWVTQHRDLFRFFFFFFKKLFGQPYLRMTIVRFFFLVYLLTLRFIIWVEFFVYFCVGTSFILFCVYVCVCKFVSK